MQGLERWQRRDGFAGFALNYWFPPACISRDDSWFTIGTLSFQKKPHLEGRAPSVARSIVEHSSRESGDRFRMRYHKTAVYGF